MMGCFGLVVLGSATSVGVEGVTKAVALGTSLLAVAGLAEESTVVVTETSGLDLLIASGALEAPEYTNFLC